MGNERWLLVEKLYHAALEHESGARAAFLAQSCAGDEELRREVENLLKYERQAVSFIETPALELQARAVAAETPAEELAQESDYSPIPRQIGQYKVISPLGKGGMGEVHLALDKRLNRKVAIKLLPTEFTADSERVRRFEQEARAASALNHPNIITIHETGESNGKRYLVTEYVEGETLRQRMANAPQKRMRLSEALEIAAQVASALQAAHAAGIIHRDIKPENVMVRKDGLVKVLDFGLAKLSRVESASLMPERVQTQSGLIMGTVTYMSPEQARGQKVDHRTDIFSLGVVLYEILAGRKPFEGKTTSDVMAAVLTSEPVSLAEVVPKVPATLWRVVRRCLEKEPEKRFQSAGDLSFALEALSSPFVIKQGKRSFKYKSSLLLIGLSVGLVTFGLYRYISVNRSAIESKGSVAQVSDRKFYWQATREEQKKLIEEQAQRISMMLGSNPYKFSDEALTQIQQEVNNYVNRRDSLSSEVFKEGLRPLHSRASLYAPFIIQGFNERHVPPVLGLYIAMIETEYHACEARQSGGKGLFSFITKTARRYGLDPNDRCDPQKISRVAAHYIDDLTAEFGSDSASMTLVILSYQMGKDSVRANLLLLLNKGIRERSYWALAAHAHKGDIVFQSSNRYVPKFFAAAIIGENPQAFDLQVQPLSTYPEIKR